MNIGTIIRNRRIELGLTLEEIGNYVGVGKSTVKKWEDGYIANMRRDKISSLAEILDIDPVSLITGDFSQLDEVETQRNVTISERLKQIMQERGLRQIDVLELCKPYCEEYGVKMGKGDLSLYISGKVLPKQSKLYVLAQALNVSEAWLNGYDIPMEREAELHTLTLTEHEKRVIVAYRDNPPMQEAVDKLLGISDEC